MSRDTGLIPCTDPDLLLMPGHNTVSSRRGPQKHQLGDRKRPTCRFANGSIASLPRSDWMITRKKRGGYSGMLPRMIEGKTRYASFL